MYRYEEPTPCPTGRMTGQAPRRTSILSQHRHNDAGGKDHTRARRNVQFVKGDTANLDFTTELRADLRNAAPRRRTGVRQPRAFNAQAEIYVDRPPSEEPDPVRDRVRRTSILPLADEKDGTSNTARILAKPAARKPLLMDPSKSRRRRVSAMVEDFVTAQNKEAQHSEGIPSSEAMRPEKEDRRRTIYIPSDDTTIMTIHPGASRKSNENAAAPSEGTRDHQALEGLLEDGGEGNPQRDHLCEKGARRAPRKSFSTAPKRAPLQPAGRIAQPSAAILDVPGRPNGKENIPPGHTLYRPARMSGVMPATASCNDKLGRRLHKGGPPGELEAIGQRKSSPETIPKKRPNDVSTFVDPKIKVSRPRRKTVAPPRKHVQPLPNIEESYSARDPIQALSGPLSGSSKEQIPSKLGVPLVSARPLSTDAYPILSEDIFRPELYEDGWLNHQEAAITQLVNGLFSAADTGITSESQQSTRRDILELYQNSSFALLHKRLQASLLYGALKIPKELLVRDGSLQEDIGRRRRFLDLWLESYNLQSLKMAAEVVVGREIRQSCLTTRRSESKSATTDKALKKTVESFLEAFLVRNEDGVHVPSDVGSIRNIARGAVAHASTLDRRSTETDKREWTWARTVLRSLMLVYLLDRSKNEGALRGSLFVKSSVHKSSASVLHGLSSLLLPCLGDITRPLGRLSYDVSHVQLPLEEYDYRIYNLATDMRDGVLLTRLVELLLYPPSSIQRIDEMTVTMPAGDVLNLTSSSTSCLILSHHLKFPCIARAQKIFNVQLALAALDGITRGTANIAGVRAEDIVDGHREKTVGLLWGLVSKWGLQVLVDWNELGREVRRLKGRFRLDQIHQRTQREGQVKDDHEEDSEGEEDLDDLEGFERMTWLLKAWASIIARKHGLRVTNLSTSFADGKVFEKIVIEYEAYLQTAEASGHCSTLESRLKSMGCSQYFASLFGRDDRRGRIMDKDFVIATLAFLCSRLLQTSVVSRAAATIQRAYRQARLRGDIYQHAVLLRLAHDCQTVVLTRERVIGAATVLQRAWRVCLEQRSNRLVHGATVFQARARGMIIRQGLRPSL